MPMGYGQGEFSLDEIREPESAWQVVPVEDEKYMAFKGRCWPVYLPASLQ